MAAEAREVRLAWSAPVPAPVIPGDRHMLARALTNLIGNAVKYAPAGSAVEVSATVAHGRCRIRVRDQGPGIAVESQHLLFRRFQRIERAEGADPGGTGLGLAFVRIVAEKHEGSVGVESAAGLGATFLLDLPVEPPAGPAVQ